MQKRAVIYCRVSSDEQAKGCSLDFQESQLREFCQKKEIEVVEVYREDYTAKTMERPEMKKLKAKYLKKRSGTDYVLVLRWNRFSRKVQQALALIDEFKVRDVEVNAIEEWIDSKDDDAIILKTLHLSMAEADNNKRSKATRDGIHATRMKGGWSNKAPRGYINKHADDYCKWVEIDPVTGPLVVEAFKEVAEGIKAPTQVWKEMCAKGLICSDSSFFEMLRNRFYIGEVFVPAYNDDPDQYVKGKHEPLIDTAVFYKVQDLLAPVEFKKRDIDTKAKKAFKVVKLPKPEFYLHDFMVCPYCGGTIVASYSQGRHSKYPYYHCNKCRKFRIRADEANRLFEEDLNAFKPRTNVLQLYQQVWDDVAGESTREEKARVVALKEEINGLNKKLEKLQDMFIDDRVSPEDFGAMSDRFKQSIVRKQDEIRVLQGQPSDREVARMIIGASHIVDHLGDLLREVPVNEKLAILGSILTGKVDFSSEKSRTASLAKIWDLIAEKSDSCKKPGKGQKTVAWLGARGGARTRTSLKDNGF